MASNLEASPAEKQLTQQPPSPQSSEAVQQQSPVGPSSLLQELPPSVKDMSNSEQEPFDNPSQRQQQQQQQLEGQQQQQQQLLEVDAAGTGLGSADPIDRQAAETWHLQQEFDGSFGGDESTPGERDTLAMQQAQAGNQQQQQQQQRTTEGQDVNPDVQHSMGTTDLPSISSDLKQQDSHEEHGTTSDAPPAGEEGNLNPDRQHQGADGSSFDDQRSVPGAVTNPDMQRPEVKPLKPAPCCLPFLPGTCLCMLMDID